MEDAADTVDVELFYDFKKQCILNYLINKYDCLYWWLDMERLLFEWNCGGKRSTFKLLLDITGVEDGTSMTIASRIPRPLICNTL